MPRLTKYGVQDKRANSSAANAEKARNALISYIKKGREMANDADDTEDEQEEQIPEDTEVELESDVVDDSEPEDELDDEPEDELEDESEEELEDESEEEELKPPTPRARQMKKKTKLTKIESDMAEMKAMIIGLNQPKTQPQPLKTQPMSSYYSHQQQLQAARNEKLQNAFLSQFN